MRLDGVIDLEAAQWTDVQVAAAYSPADGKRAFRTVDDLVSYLLARGGWWWSWAGGHYDLLAVADSLYRRVQSCQPNRSGSRLTSIVVGSLRLIDAYALIPLALDRAAGLAGHPPPGELGWPCRCGEQCGGYCQIRRDMTLGRRAELIDYCIRDCVVGYDVIAAVLDHCREQGYEARTTIGSTAWATAQAWLELPAAEWHHGTWRRVARAYHGGRTVVGRAFARSGARWDLRSAYPAALASTAVPVGPAAELGARRAALALRHGTPGVYVASVDVPALDHPPLPWRSPAGRLTYPWGRFTGSWTAPELLAAESRGVTIEAVHEAVAWPDGAAVTYEPVVTHWYAQRFARGPDSPWADWYRELANSLTGKLGERPDREVTLMHPGSDRVVICDGRSDRSRAAGCSREHCTGRCGAWRQLDPWGLIWGAPVWRLGACAHVHHAAYLTAATRLELLEGIEAVGADRHVYSATDSIFADDSGDYMSEPSPGNVGEELGQWGAKGRWAEWECRAPGRYRYLDCETGEAITRIAGASRANDRTWRTMAIHERAVHDARGVATFGEAVATGRLWQRRHRAVSMARDDGWRGDRILAETDGRTYPAHHGQIVERDRRSQRRQEAAP